MHKHQTETDTCRKVQSEKDRKREKERETPNRTDPLRQLPALRTDRREGQVTAVTGTNRKTAEKKSYSRAGHLQQKENARHPLARGSRRSRQKKK